MASFPDVPKIISVDDHVVEPPELWTNRLPAKYQDRAPRIVREKCTMKMVGGVFTFERNVPNGDWCDVWLYDDLVYPFPKLSAASGFANLDNEPVTFEQISRAIEERRTACATETVPGVSGVERGLEGRVDVSLGRHTHRADALAAVVRAAHEFGAVGICRGLAANDRADSERGLQFTRDLGQDIGARGGIG